MNNQITASIEFYFKGKKYSASIELDLDQTMRNVSKMPDLYPLLAKAINLDLYSYEYEMMLAETIHYSHGNGMVKNFIIDGSLDSSGFEQAWKEKTIFEALQKIATQYLNINDLHQQTEIKNALLAAYHLGTHTPANT